MSVVDNYRVVEPDDLNSVAGVVDGAGTANAAGSRHTSNLYDPSKDQAVQYHTMPLPGQDFGPVMREAAADGARAIPFTALDPPCCSTPSRPPTCPEREAWRFKFKGCQTNFSTGGPGETCRVAPRGDRYSLADLNPVIFERGKITGAMWNPYQHMRARQGLAQFLMADMRRDGDPYTRPVRNVGDTYCNRQRQQGPPAYTQF